MPQADSCHLSRQDFEGAVAGSKGICGGSVLEALDEHRSPLGAALLLVIGLW